MQTSTPLVPGNYYHIYNRGNNRENIFLEERNYPYFLQRYTKYIVPVAETFAYCLMRNHFHFLIRIRAHRVEESQAAAVCETAAALAPKDISKQFDSLFNSYAKSINKAYGRTGALFQKRFGRVLVDNDRYFLTLLHYIRLYPK